MAPRLFSVIIIGFWTVMTGMLVQSIWFPADSRLMKVDPGAVFQLIAARGEPSTLDVYDDRKIVGQVTITATQLRQGARHPVKLRINGRINPDFPLLAGVKLELESWAELDHGGGITAFDLRLSTGKNGMSLQVSQSGPDVSPMLLLDQGGMVILDSKTLPQENAESSPLESFLLGVLGISQTELTAIRQQAEVDAGGRPGVSTVEAKRIKDLEREVKELRRANEILKLASAFFAQAELDRRLKS